MLRLPSGIKHGFSRRAGCSEVAGFCEVATELQCVMWCSHPTGGRQVAGRVLPEMCGFFSFSSQTCNYSRSLCLPQCSNDDLTLSGSVSCHRMHIVCSPRGAVLKAPHITLVIACVCVASSMTMVSQMFYAFMFAFNLNEAANDQSYAVSQRFGHVSLKMALNLQPNQQLWPAYISGLSESIYWLPCCCSRR